jgi:hypothetical protein
MKFVNVERVRLRNSYEEGVTRNRDFLELPAKTGSGYTETMGEDIG